jgi:hypothetical protein
MTTNTDWNISGSFDGMPADGADDMESGAISYPSIQITNYSPTPNDRVKFCLSPATAENLGESSADLIDLKPEICYYKSGDVPMMATDSIGFVLLKQPKLLAQNRSSGELIPANEGDYRNGQHVSITWLIVAITAKNDFVRDKNGQIQPFTLKLTSSKTKLVGNANASDSLLGLNKVIQQRLKIPSKFLLYLVSFELYLICSRFTSKSDPSKSSFAIDYRINKKSVKMLPKELANEMSVFLAENDELRAFHAQISSPTTTKLKPVIERVGEAVAEEKMFDDTIRGYIPEPSKAKRVKPVLGDSEEFIPF